MYRSEARWTERRQAIAALYLQGRYQFQIAASLSISQQLVSRELSTIQRLWLHSTIRDFDAAKAQELAKLDAAEREYWEGWRRSCQDAEQSIMEASDTPEGGRRHKVVTRKQGQSGDPRFLDGVLRCIEKRCDILGISTAATATKELAAGLTSLLTEAKALQLTPPPAQPALAPPVAEA